MNAMELTGKDLIAYRTARLFKDGDVVNLGIGMPTKCLDYLPEGVDVWVDSENGVVGLTGAPKEGEYADPNVVDAGGKPSVLRVGGSCFDSFRSFGFIRGGHVDATVLGAYEVDAEGNLANWMIPGKTAAGMGGAMDLVTGSKVTIVMTTHCDKKGNPKIVEKTNMPAGDRSRSNRGRGCCKARRKADHPREGRLHGYRVIRTFLPPQANACGGFLCQQDVLNAKNAL